MMESYSGANTGAVVGSFLSTLPIDYGQRTSDVQEKSEFPSSANLIEKPRILIMGMRRSGKSSIQKVVFHKMAPNETLFLESTNKIVKDDVSDCSFIQFQIWDFPGHINFLDREIFDFESVFENSGAIIFVIDSQDDYTEALARLHVTIMRAFKANPDIKIEIFIHKVDGLNDDQKIETQRDINQRAMDDLLESGLDAVHLSFHLTTIYDHSIFEAFSKVVQKLIPVMGAFENLLNIFCSNSCLEKAFLFDIATKIYLATDYTPVDMQTYELCCDMIDVVMDVASIYGHPNDSAANVMDPPFTEETGSLIRLNNNTVLYMHGINKYLALVCIIRLQAMNKFGIIEYNYQCVKEGLQKILELRKETKEAEIQRALQQQERDQLQNNHILDEEDGAVGGTPIPGSHLRV